ncbi:MAG: hypothetical protein JWO86_2333 [Myxococcaceae bacterium]|nr:hypothetical protein [Myxococcaceae bacterium]MEA2748852.1 hypothetical protein [Myxococcales bacterium]
MRDPLSLTHVDFDPSLGFSLPGAYGGTDFDNRGENGAPGSSQRTNRFLSYNAGLEVQVGPVGVTVLGDFLNYSVGSALGSSVSLTLGRIHTVAAYGFADNQVIIGAGARVIFVNVQEQSSNGSLVRMLGAAPQLGVIVKPNDVRWRIGTTARAAVDATPFALGTTSSPSTGVQQAGSFVLPRTITQPWELEAGVAYQLGPRPLNPVWIEPHAEDRALEDAMQERRKERKALYETELASMPQPTTDEEKTAQAVRRFTIGREELAAEEREDQELADARSRAKDVRKARYLNWPREHLLMLASVVFTGPSDQAVALEGFIDQTRELVGQSVSISPRFAVESEPIPNLIRARTGVYFEPSRFSDGTHRQHATFGGDLRLFSWDIFGIIADTTWRISAFFDVAPRYQNVGLSIGPWH